MLTNWELTNVPEGGVRHIVPGLGDVEITEEVLTDEIVDILISYGVDQYFKRKSDGQESKPTTAKRNSGRSGKQPATGTTTGADATDTTATGTEAGADATSTATGADATGTTTTGAEAGK